MKTTKTPSRSTKILASNPRPSVYFGSDREHGLDIDVVVKHAGAEHAGEVTLIRDHNDEWSVWGAPDNWLSSSILSHIRHREDCNELLQQIAATVCAYANAADVLTQEADRLGMY